MRHLLQTIQRTDVIERVDGRAEATVQAEYLAVHQRGQRQEVEQIGEVLPYGRVAVFAETLVVETVHLGDLAGLVVAAKDCYSFTVPHLQQAIYMITKRHPTCFMFIPLSSRFLRLSCTHPVI